jgi:hypothetical protein
VLALALGVLAGCGSDTDDPSDGQAAQDVPSATSSGSPTSGGGDDADDGATDACALLTQVEVSDAVGTEVGPGRASSGAVATGGSQSTCEWFSVEQPADTAKLTIYSETSAADSVKDSDPDAKPLADVGDQAFIGAFASVWVYQGDQSFMAQWYSMTASDDESLPKSEALAKLAADRL